MKKLRYISESLEKALETRMVFIGGPRQVGKTTLSLNYLKPQSIKSPAYLNWDRNSDRSLILRDQIPLNQEVIVFDEIHKFRNWRNFLKGLYDKNHDSNKFIVTGSARLDYFRKGGDSLFGRYRYFRLHPFTLTELSSNPTQSDLKDLLAYSGFPEPFFSQNGDTHRLWQRERAERVIREDLRDLENIRDLSLVELLAEILPSKVGSPLSLKSLQEDLQVSQPTVARWVQALCHMYFCFLIPPFGSPKIRAVKKLQKLYFWDWSQLEEEGFRFENLVASHLLKYCHFVEDTKGHKMELTYLRDTDGREIDFVVLKDKKPLFAVECKSGDRSLSSNIKYFKERTSIPAFYQVHTKDKDFGKKETGRVMPFTKFCVEIGLV